MDFCGGGKIADTLGMFDKLLHVWGTLQMAIEIYVANPSSFKRDWSFSLSRGREDITGGRRKGGD